LDHRLGPFDYSRLPHSASLRVVFLSRVV